MSQVNKEKDAYSDYPIFHYNPKTPNEIISSALIPPGIAKIVLRYLDGDIQKKTESKEEAKTISLPPQTLFGKPLAEVILLPVASRVAMLILGGESHEIEEAIALTKKYPEILRITVTARDRSGSPGFCLMKDETDAVLKNRNRHLHIKRAIDNGLDYKIFDTQGNLMSDHITPEELGQEIKEEPTLHKLNPLRGLILKVTSQRGHTPLGRAVRGTVLQIAAMAGDLSLLETTVEKEQGVVERLASIKDGLSFQEVKNQLNEAIAGENATNKNMEKVKCITAAITKFGDGILKKAKKYNNNVRDYSNFSAFQKICQPLIDELEQSLQHDPKKVTTSGYIFDLLILQRAAEWFEKKISCFGGTQTILSEVFWVNGVGKLQLRLSARDKQILSSYRGMSFVLDQGGVPSRTSYASSGTSFLDFSSGCGVYFYVGYLSGCHRGGWGLSPLPHGSAAVCMEKLISIKNSSLAEFTACDWKKCSVM